MKISVDAVSIEGLLVEEFVEPSVILADFDAKDINFSDPVKVSANLRKFGKELFADIKIEAPVEYTCARCLAKIHDVFKKDFNIEYEVNPGDIIELNEDIRQEIILDYPIKIVCKPDCKGLCPNCGQNLNVDKCNCG